MRFCYALLIVVLLVSPADARRVRNGAGWFKYWSPGAFKGLIGQNSGPRMVWRGDWVIKQKRGRR